MIDTGNTPLPAKRERGLGSIATRWEGEGRTCADPTKYVHKRRDPFGAKQQQQKRFCGEKSGTASLMALGLRDNIRWDLTSQTLRAGSPNSSSNLMVRPTKAARPMTHNVNAFWNHKGFASYDFRMKHSLEMCRMSSKKLRNTCDQPLTLPSRCDGPQPSRPLRRERE
jgi:hypothetical protein